MVSLPQEWIKAHNLKKGDELDYTIKGRSIKFFPYKVSCEQKTITLDLTDLDRSSIMFLLRALYRKGYQEIRLSFAKPYAYHYRGKKAERIASIVLEEVKCLVAIEITEHKEHSIVLKQLAEPTQEELKTTILHIFHMISDLFHDLIEGVKKQDKMILQSLEEKHDTVTKLISFTLRILYRFTGYPQVAFLIHTLMVLDTLLDLLKYYGQMLMKAKDPYPKDLVSYLQAIADYYNTYKKFFFSWENKDARDLNKQRQWLKETFLQK